jgi:ATP-dependent DNA ligase
MMAVSAGVLPRGAGWPYEVKWDGYRAQAVKHGTSVSLASRNLENITRSRPSIIANHQEFVIGGFKPNTTNFDSLLVGCYEGSKLVCGGKDCDG